MLDRVLGACPKIQLENAFYVYLADFGSGLSGPWLMIWAYPMEETKPSP